MKVLKSLLFVFAWFSFLAVEAQVDYDDYFTDNQLRIDYYVVADANNVVYAIDKMVKEPVWGGRRHNLVDNMRYGNFYFEVKLPETDKVIYSYGYCALFGEWQTTEEALRTKRGFSETVVMPFPKQPVEVVFYFRTLKGTLQEVFRYSIDPENYFIADAKRLPYEIYNVYGEQDPEEAVDIVILPDGYTMDEMEKFKKDCDFFVESLFSYKPYDKYPDCFNVRAVLVPSQDSGITVPADDIWKNTAIGCSFYTLNSERYCMTYENKTMRDLAGQVPYDQIYILANTEKYGGGGIFNSYCVSSSANSFSSEVIIHEFGHGFAGLGDEYAYDGGANYPLDVEPWEPNITTLVDFESKWQDLVKKKTPIPTPVKDKNIDVIGAYEGAGYQLKGIYRPKMDCLMNTFNGKVFCEACERAIERMILYYSE